MTRGVAPWRSQPAPAGSRHPPSVAGGTLASRTAHLAGHAAAARRTVADPGQPASLTHASLTHPDLAHASPARDWSSRRGPRSGGGSLVRRILLGAALLAAGPVRASEAPPGWEAAWDYLVQDVCVDAAGRTVIGVTPLDGADACPVRRKLAIGEPLPYHKRDWPGTADRDARRDGYQASDSIPVRTSLGPAVLQTYDFGDPPRRFGQLDQGDGGQIAFFTQETASFGITEDGGAGLQLFIGPGCAAVDGWVVVGSSFATRPSGSILARITRQARQCPDRLGYAYTRWHVQPVSYRTNARGRPGRAELQTLVSEHFGGRDVEGADHLERFQFTQALGYTRWERWQNLASRNLAEDRAQAADLAASGRCEPGLGPPGNGSWILVDCRQWTQIVGPDDPRGDPPGPWLDRLRASPVTRGMMVP